MAKQGQDLTFIAPSYTKGVRTPDIEFEGLKWEIKAPIGKSRWTIENQFKRASRQCENIILDVRNVVIPDEKVLDAAQKLFQKKSFRKMKIITKKNLIIDFTK